ncbi:armadillo-type protein [Endogone sp. FLAS-F59071]|nr:armadillo-type protein [Endogone sp. FLAS-F59071]|eukprot:RUS18450.1 armadillo-type protein [Endogone sp. FLAS-F59071]
MADVESPMQVEENVEVVPAVRSAIVRPQPVSSKRKRFKSPSTPRSRSRSRSRSHSRTPSPSSSGSRSVSPNSDHDRKPILPKLIDVNSARRRERERQLYRQYQQENELPPPKKREMDPIAEQEMLITKTRTGGAYIPPHRLRQLQQNVTNKSSEEYQRITWEALKKSINGLINKVNISNIKNIIQELFGENLIRGSGLFARSIMKAQSASLPFTPVYAALVAVINTKLPTIGELVLTRLILQFRRAFKRNDKTTCLAVTTFIAHLFNHYVIHEILVLEILTLLLENATDDSVEVAVGFMKEAGSQLAEVTKSSNAVFDRFRAILHEGVIDKRVQYMIEVLFQVRKDKFKDNPPVPEELDLVDEADLITHNISLVQEDLIVKEHLNIFKYDPEYELHEEVYKKLKDEVLGNDEDDGESGSESGSENGEDDESGSEDEKALEQKMQIQDQTNTYVINLRRSIYLTIMSSVDYEECCHKLMKLNIQEGQEHELCNMIIECCAQERTYLKFFGLMGERFCKLNRTWAEAFEQGFLQTFETVHRYETNRLRNVAKYFGHLLATDSINWTVLSVLKLTEDDTTSASRIFIKILFQEVSETLGLKKLNERLKDPYMRQSFVGMFPMENPKNTRFAINYWTSIGLGGLTDELREWLKNAPKMIMQQAQDAGSSDSDDDDSESESESESGSDESDSASKSDNDSKSEDDNYRHGDRRSSRKRSGSADDRRRSGRDQGSGRRRGRDRSYDSDRDERGRDRRSVAREES